MKPIRRILMLLLTLTLISCLSALAFAQERNLPDGFLIGDNTGISVNESGKVYLSADDVKPGDVIKRTLSMANYEDSGSYYLYLITSDVETEGKINWGKESFLKLYLDGELIYEGSFLGDGADTAKHKGNGKEFIDTPLELGLFIAGQQKRLDAELYIDGSQLDYWTLAEASKTIVYWEFFATHLGYPTEPTTTKAPEPTPPGATNPPVTTQPSQGGKPGPDTGDIVRTGLYILLGAAAGGIIVLLLIKRKYKNDEEAVHEPYGSSVPDMYVLPTQENNPPSNTGI